MMKYKIIFCLIFIILLIPENALGADLTLTGYGSASYNLSGFYSKDGSSISCSGGGLTISFTAIKAGGGKCATSGHTKGNGDYCCPNQVGGSGCYHTDSGYTTSGCYISQGLCDGNSNCKFINGSCKRWYSDTVTDAESDYLHNYNVRIQVSGSGKCGTSTVSCSDGNGTTKSFTVKTFEPWREHQITGSNRCYNFMQMNKYYVQYTGESIAYGEPHFGNLLSPKDGIYCYDTYYTRGCPSGPGAGDVPRSNVPMGCWRKENPAATSDYNKYIYEWSYGPNNSYFPGWEFIPESRMSESQCKANEPSVCTPSATTISKNNNSARYCSREPVDVNFNSSYGCTTSETSFYSITCSDSLKATYAPEKFTKVLDGGVVDARFIYLQAGQGFGFNINLNHVKSCVGNFDSDKFNESYDKATHYIQRANIAGHTKEIAWYTNLRDGYLVEGSSERTGGIVGIAREYKDKYDNLVSRKKFIFDYKAGLSFAYKYKGSSKTYRGNFEKIDEEEKLYLNGGSVKYTKTMGLRNGMSIHNFNYKLIQESSMKPVNTYFDKYSGKETTKTLSNDVVDGGRKFYTNIQTDVTNGTYYDLNINLEVYNGTKLISTVTNNVCDLGIYENDLKYRIINVTNPFVNSTREIPKNWLNNVYDYTKTIKSDTWSRSALYRFNISKEDLTDIKRSNYNDSNSYLGTCYKPVANQDYAIRSICNIINSK